MTSVSFPFSLVVEVNEYQNPRYKKYTELFPDLRLGLIFYLFLVKMVTHPAANRLFSRLLSSCCAPPVLESEGTQLLSSGVAFLDLDPVEQHPRCWGQNTWNLCGVRRSNSTHGFSGQTTWNLCGEVCRTARVHHVGTIAIHL